VRDCNIGNQMAVQQIPCSKKKTWIS